jgi:hypothetical protein
LKEQLAISNWQLAKQKCHHWSTLMALIEERLTLNTRR